MSRARTSPPEAKHCPGSHASSGPDRMTCPGRECRNDQGTGICPGVDLRAAKDRILSGKSRNIMNKSEVDDAESIGSSDDSQAQLSQPWENGSETTSNSDVSEIAIRSLLVELKQRGLDREMHQDPDKD